jgi:hypothetical protein
VLAGAAGAAVWAMAALLAKAKVIRDKAVFFMGFSKVRSNPISRLCATRLFLQLGAVSLWIDPNKATCISYLYQWPHYFGAHDCSFGLSAK